MTKYYGNRRMKLNRKLRKENLISNLVLNEKNSIILD